MIQTTIKNGIGLLALIALSACATQERSEEVADEPKKKCRPNETLTCDEFADETYNCTCEKGDNLRDMLDAYRKPDY